MMANLTAFPVLLFFFQNAEVVVHGEVWNEANARAQEVVAKNPGKIYPESARRFVISHRLT